MTRKEAARWMEFMIDRVPKEPPEGCDYLEEWTDSHDEVLQAYRVAIQCLLTEPSDDAISRQAVERLTWEEPSYSDSLNALTEVRYKVRSLPSVTLTRKKGKWIEGSTEPGALGIIHPKKTCSKCGWSHSLAIPQNYCPKCGAEMESE